MRRGLHAGARGQDRVFYELLVDAQTLAEAGVAGGVDDDPVSPGRARRVPAEGWLLHR